MGIQDFFIYLMGVLSVISALGVVFSRKSLTSAMSLVATMVCIAGQFALMRADFMATIQILVYAGAIMILVVFVIMLLGIERESENFSFGLPLYMGGIFAVIFIGVIYYLVSFTDTKSFVHTASLITGNEVEPSGERSSAVYRFAGYLLNDHFIAFHACGFLLLAAILGAALLSFPSAKPLLPGRGLRAVRKKFNKEE